VYAKSQLSAALIARAVCCKWCAVFSAYLDESYDGLIFAMGAWVGPAESFPSLERQWRRLIKHHGLKRYHASEANARDHDFKDWSKPELDVLSKSLIRIITHRRPNSRIPRHIYGIHTGVVLSEYNKMSPHAKNYYPDPYFLCAQWMFEEIADLSVKLPEEDKVDFIFDENKPHADRMAEIYIHLKTSPKTKNPSRLGAWSMASSFDVCALQAADILAYETFRELKRQLVTPDRKVRPALQSMFGGNVRISGRYFDSEACKNISQRAEELRISET